MDIAVNGVWGNMGVGFAAFITGLMIDYLGWRFAFWIPGVLSVIIGIAYFFNQKKNILVNFKNKTKKILKKIIFQTLKLLMN